jgi:hypothetical protein
MTQIKMTEIMTAKNARQTEVLPRQAEKIALLTFYPTV